MIRKHKNPKCKGRSFMNGHCLTCDHEAANAKNREPTLLQHALLSLNQGFKVDLETKKMKTIRAIPQGGYTWSIMIDGSFVEFWDYEDDASADAIEDYAYVNDINLDDYEVIIDV